MWYPPIDSWITSPHFESGWCCNCFDQESDFLEFLCPRRKRTVSFCFPLLPWNSAMVEVVQEALSINPSGEDRDPWWKSQPRPCKCQQTTWMEPFWTLPGLPALQLWSPFFSVLSKLKICYILPEISWFLPSLPPIPLNRNLLFPLFPLTLSFSFWILSSPSG